MEFPTIPMQNKRILVVEQDEPLRKQIAQALQIEGYMTQQASDGATAVRYLEQLPPDLIIADIGCGLNGGRFYQALRQNAAWTAIPLIVLVDPRARRELERARDFGVEDYLAKPVDFEALARIVHVRLLRHAELQVALIDQAYLETIEVLAKTVEGRDPYTHGHIDRVSLYAQWLAEALNWPKDQLRNLAFGARLHDIGKIIVPDHILKKPGDLSEEEWALMRQHPQAGAKILGNIKHLQGALNYVLYHHERWDGSGYPYGLQGRDIPIEGRLLAIVDVFDALTTERPYHAAQPRPLVLEHLQRNAGVLFDPDLVPIFVQTMRQRLKHV